MVPALPDVLSGRVPTDALTRPIAEILGPSFDVVVDEAVAVDPARGRVEGRTGTYEFDGLVIATGSVPTAAPESLGGAKIHTVHSARAAAALREAVVKNRRARQSGAPLALVVVGAGYTGLETAYAARRGVGDAVEIIVVDTASHVLPMLTPRERDRVTRLLEHERIEVRTETAVESARPTQEGDLSKVTLTDGSTVENALLLWTAGMRASSVGLAGSFATTADGRLKTTEHLELAASPGVFVAGDAAALNRSGTIVRRAVNFAYYSGRAAGSNLAARLSGSELTPHVPFDLGWIIPVGEASVGRLFGTVPIRGRFALRAHYLMCGFRHFGGGRAWPFYGAALRLSGDADPLAVRATVALQT